MDRNTEKRGLFIVLEGIDGAGKTTQAELLEAHLLSLGRRVHRTAEPTSYPSGVALREALSGRVCKTECEMATMFTLDRIAHNTDKDGGLAALLEAGISVICDRYYYSTLAYQGHSTDYEWVKAMNLSCPEILKPDVCIYLDLTPEQSLERIRRGRDGVEIYENLDTLEKVRRAFFYVFEDLSESENIAIVDAYRDPSEISKDLCGIVDAVFDRI